MRWRARRIGAIAWDFDELPGWSLLTLVTCGGVGTASLRVASICADLPPSHPNRQVTTLLARTVIGIALLLVAILLLAAVSTFVSHLLASVLGGLMFIAALAWLVGRDRAPAPEGAAAGTAAAAEHDPSGMARDVDRVCAWCRTAVTARIPERGSFAPIRETLDPEARPLSGLTIHLAATPLPDGGTAGGDVRVLTLRVEGQAGAYLQSDVDMGTSSELLARLDAGDWTARLTRLLERAAEELPRAETEAALHERAEHLHRPTPTERADSGRSTAAGEDMADRWSLSGYDAFEGSGYPMGRFASAAEARAYALQLLRDRDLASRGGDGGQLRGGIQDRIFLIDHLEASTERILPPSHPMPIFLAERSVSPEHVVLRHADARSAVDFFSRSTSCVVIRVEAWILRESASESPAPTLVRAAEMDGRPRDYHLPAGHMDSRHVVRESAGMAHRDLTDAYERWRKQRGAEDTEICFAIVAQDEIPVRS